MDFYAKNMEYYPFPGFLSRILSTASDDASRDNSDGEIAVPLAGVFSNMIEGALVAFRYLVFCLGILGSNFRAA